MIDYKDLLHRYIWHVGYSEGVTFIPEQGEMTPLGPKDRWIVFTDEEVNALKELDTTEPRHEQR